MFGELAESEEGGAAHHLVVVGETLAHRLQHRRQHPGGKDRGETTALRFRPSFSRRLLTRVRLPYLVRMWSPHPSARTARHMRPPFLW